MATVLVADQIAEQGIARLRERHDALVSTGLSEDELVEAVADVAGIIVRSQTRVTERIIEAAPQLEVIGRAGVGVDNIDLDAATARGVVVVNAPLSNTMSAIEHAFAMLLAVARNVPQGHASLREGRWERSSLQGVELAGHTLGVVGLGRIGSGVAARARAFEMRVIAHDPFVSSERAASIGVELVSLDELLEQADFVTLHTALHEGTRGLIGGEQLARMKPGAYLVNTARGALVDEQALHEAVAGGVIAGAAIDVFSEEPAIGNVLTTTRRRRRHAAPRRLDGRGAGPRRRRGGRRGAGGARGAARTLRRQRAAGGPGDDGDHRPLPRRRRGRRLGRLAAAGRAARAAAHRLPRRDREPRGWARCARPPSSACWSPSRTARSRSSTRTRRRASTASASSRTVARRASPTPTSWSCA